MLYKMQVSIIIKLFSSMDLQNDEQVEHLWEKFNLCIKQPSTHYNKKIHNVELIVITQ